ncbi:MAG: thioesterase [Novosphingobium sp. PASSN1]|nr:MAG: thioesterase [Novosphingobium sp. PASSN1]
MDVSEPKAGRGKRADYVRFTPVATRWMDNDVYGHLNNVVYYSLFDTAVNATLIGEGLLDPAAGSMIALVVETGCRYHASVGFPQPVEVGLRVAKLGTSSIRYELGVFAESEELAAAEGFFVHVCVDAETRRPVPLPPAKRAFLETLQTTVTA